MVVWVPLLGGGEDLVEVVYGPLYAMYFALFRALYDKGGTDDVVSSGNVEVERLVFLGDGKDRGSRQNSLEICKRGLGLGCPLKLLRLFQQVVERQCLLAEPADESAECR